MSHDKKKSKKAVNDAHVTEKAVSDTVKGSANSAQKGSGEAKTGVTNTVPDTKKKPQN